MNNRAALWIAFWSVALVISVTLPTPWANGLIPVAAIPLGGWLRIATQEHRQHRSNQPANKTFQEEQ